MPDPNLPTETDEQQEPVTPQPASEPIVPPITPNEPPADPAPQPIDYETKFKESTREAQILAAQLDAERAKSRKELTNEPTDSDLRAAFPEWDYMTDTEKALGRRTFAIERISTTLHQEREQEKAERRWNTDLELTIASNPSLQGKEQGFKEFAKKPTHRGAPLETLVSAFLFESSSNPSPVPPPPPQPGLLPGVGGPREAEKPKLLSGAELKQLRETDDKGYREYISTHDLSDIAD
jgi:hypothetical protein